MVVRLSSEQPHDEGEDGGDQQAGHQGKVEAEVCAFDVDIARQAAEPGGESGGEGDDQAGGHQQQPRDDQRAAEAVHAAVPLGR